VGGPRLRQPRALPPVSSPTAAAIALSPVQVALPFAVADQLNPTRPFSVPVVVIPPPTRRDFKHHPAPQRCPARSRISSLVSCKTTTLLRFGSLFRKAIPLSRQRFPIAASLPKIVSAVTHFEFRRAPLVLSTPHNPHSILTLVAPPPADLSDPTHFSIPTLTASPCLNVSGATLVANQRPVFNSAIIERLVAQRSSSHPPSQPCRSKVHRPVPYPRIPLARTAVCNPHRAP
jgi:hypothetical protein